MAKILNAQKQKDTRTLTYDPEKDSLSLIINEFYAFKKNAKFLKEYSEMEIFEKFQAIRWMKTMDEKLQTAKQESQKRQYKISAKYESYIEYKKWSESPIAQRAHSYSKTARVLIIVAVAALISIMLLIIVGLNKWW
ncbi:hypothetical protein R9B83_00795 [Metamycoplasma equirhinis]|uniref:Uncharacterized protein n=1 Tax=Metamycoplasma equirhinis TaxID=92402 RepID=A0ABZ0PAQ7_9BACT|nr:hypothetical protein [Metamycoplasma equirhinis]TPD98260.1 hypothetical protein FJM08_02125 [Metamycoplasma equirhinis]WPB54098.1 hypothetical protein R9B83_00795 [Metamycoplasma equirhinis]